LGSCRRLGNAVNGHLGYVWSPPRRRGRCGNILLVKLKKSLKITN
jgi:hypothetical protein